MDVKHILIVDDDDAIRFGLGEYLRTPGIQVDSAASLGEALDLLERHSYHAVVTDLRLSGTSGEEGFDLLRRVREKGLGAKVILITGYGSEEYRKTAEALGAVRYFEKPVSGRRLADEVYSLLGIKAPGMPARRGRQHKPVWAKLLGRPVQFGLDILVLVGAFVFCYLLRFEFVVPNDQLGHALIQLPLVVLIQFAALFVFGVYDFIWRYVGLKEMWTFVKAAVAALLPILALRLFLPGNLQHWKMPLSIIVMDTLTAFGGALGLRVLRRVLYERYERQQALQSFSEEATSGRGNGVGGKKRVLLIGAGRAGVLASRELSSRPDLGIEVMGFLDDDPEKLGAVINGVKVLAGTDRLPALVADKDIDHVIITIAHASRGEIGHIVKLCERAQVKTRIIPGLFELLDGKVNVNRIRDVEIEDLLGRDAVRLDDEEVGRFLTGKAVMVTGAGGSIGSELARQIARVGPSSLLLVERAEFVLFDIDRSLRDLWPDIEVVPLVADAGDEVRMRSLLSAYKPDVIFHAAAHKHVPMMETNPTEAIKNNVLATSRLGRLAGECGVGAFVMISTDKAVNPTSVMGASKRLAELVVQGLEGKYATRYVAVRFGNVLGSTGSVIPLFREQIARGGPITVTHPDMVRYFMTIPEAAQLVLQAGAMGEGGEIFVLDMGEPVRILDLAKEMITLSGLRPFEDVDIAFTGPRPGEKLFEELGTSEEKVEKTRHPKIFIGKIGPFSNGQLEEVIKKLDALSTDGDERALRMYLNEILPEARVAVGGEKVDVRGEKKENSEFEIRNSE